MKILERSCILGELPQGPFVRYEHDVGVFNEEEREEGPDEDDRIPLVLNLTQPIFQGGRLREGVTRAQAIEAEALANYTAAVLNVLAVFLWLLSRPAKRLEEF